MHTFGRKYKNMIIVWETRNEIVKGYIHSVNAANLKRESWILKPRKQTQTITIKI